MVGGCGQLIRFIMILANLVILLGGAGLFGFGIWTMVDRSFVQNLLGTEIYTITSGFLIGIGLIVMIISFFGCCGAIKEIRCMLFFFFVILFLIFVVILIGAVLGYVFKDEIDRQINREMASTVPSYGNNSKVTESWDTIQRNFNCCGVFTNGTNGQPPQPAYKIWNRNQNLRGAYPRSCCKRDNLDRLRQCEAPTNNPGEADINTADCTAKVKDLVSGLFVIIGIVGIGIAFILIIGMMLSCALMLMIE